jgi:O-antigen/teichoic acid export membrane protein
VIKVLETWQRSRGSFAVNAVLTGLTNLVLVAVGLITGAAAARLLGPQGRGELAAIQTWPMFIGYLSLLGTSDALVYYSAKEPKNAASYLGTAATIAILAAGPFMLSAYTSLPFLLSAQSWATIKAARGYLMMVPVVALVGLSFHPLRGLNDFAAWNVLRLTPALVWAMILAVAWLFACHSPIILAYSNLAGLALLFFPVAFVVKRRVPGSFYPVKRGFEQLLRYGLPCMMSTFPQVLNFRLDQMLMAGLLPPMQLGLYVAAVAWSGAINPLLNALAWALFPRVAAEASMDRRAYAFIQGSRLAFFLALGMGAALLAVTPWGLILLFGPKFRPAVLAAIILVPAGSVSGLNMVIEEGLRGLGRPASVMHAEFIGLGVTAVSLALMLRRFGIVGASISSLLGYGTVTIVLVSYSRSLTGVSASTLFFPNKAELYSVMRQVVLMRR